MSESKTKYIEPIEGLLVEVRVLEERTPYGKQRFKIEPVAGKVTKEKGVWVELKSLKDN